MPPNATRALPVQEVMRTLKWREREQRYKGYRATIRKVFDATSSEVLVEAEVSRHGSWLARGRLGLLVGFLHDTRLLVVTNALLEEVGLAVKRDVLHEVEGVGGVVELLVAQCHQQAVCDELNVLAHKIGVHAEESDGKGIREELLLDIYGLGDDLLDGIGAGLRLDVREQQASEVGMHTLVTRDELVRESETGHEATLLQPEDGSEGSTEEDTLDSRKSDQARCEGRVLVADPAQGPVGLLLDTRNYEASVIHASRRGVW